MIFKAVGDGRPYPDHGRTTARDWSSVPPRQVRLDELVTTKRVLDLGALLSE
ncbi:MAG: type II toxin-antitoxin system VapB family antitoxin, partial [Angustibacter sp.]